VPYFPHLLSALRRIINEVQRERDDAVAQLRLKLQEQNRVLELLGEQLAGAEKARVHAESDARIFQRKLTDALSQLESGKRQIQQLSMMMAQRR
jgi:hypothetical protein